ncbi:DUF4373 domain-containing protein [Dellaglioa algida]|uniref:DUF4373 domain-containing protein n=1 Tax=Dellaglioa algida TaxID=105612 RepID=UPI0024C4ADC7|nr:DUF4373 domain-containing protein [Dellaglioa algida]MDK1718693.1 DUF4373 domain-containing protein [Dellaglioa algida]
MARPVKKGISYFPLDVDFLKDMKVRKVMRACGSSAPTILVCLLGNIYGDEGYYMLWDEDIRFLVADDVGTSEALVEEVVIKAIQVGLFNKNLFDTYKILTSHGIQERYKRAAYQKLDSKISEQYDLLDVSSTDNGVNHIGNEVNHVESTQSILKETKVNKTKVNKSAENDSAESDFDKLWSLYPRKEGRKTALAAYKRAIKKGATNKLIQNGIVQYSKHIEVKNTDKQYIKTGATFFSQEAWNDEFDMTPGQAHSFGKVTKKESLPDWAKDDYEPPEETSTVDKVALQKQLDEFNKTSPKEN